MPFLFDFQVLRPSFQSKQEDTLKWLIDLHIESEKRKQTASNEQEIREEIQKRVEHVSCKSPHIEMRGHVLQDCLHRDWDKMEVYHFSNSSGGASLEQRLKIYEKEADLIFETFYPKNAVFPHDLIHATCTGYIAPSGAQKIVSKRRWNTEIIHAYHMGCYASIPSIRIAKGLILAEPQKRCDIVHTEICSLHMNSFNHNKDQLVSQSLFSDGFIKYSVGTKCKSSCLEILALHEQVIPDSLKFMTWNLASWGFKISLSKEVPLYIRQNLKTYLKALFEKAGMDESLEKAYFAIHPGGPKIIEQIEKFLQLDPQQTKNSRAILKKYGNMSSATLPHVWDEMIQDPTIEKGSLIVSLAFGPGLSICGTLLRKIN